MKYINENYNIGLLILVHLLLVVILELYIFYYVLKPTIKKHMKYITDDLPKFNEETLNNYGIYHNKFSNVLFNKLLNENQSVNQLFDIIDDIKKGYIPVDIESYFDKKGLEYKEKEHENSTKMKYKIWYIIIAILMTICVWYIIYMKYKSVNVDIIELILGNIIPLTIIFIFELYFIKNITTHYIVMGKHEFLYTILDRIYS